MIPEQRDPTDAALDAIWRCIADACIEHDADHERRALAELARLLNMPEPRP